MKPLYKILIIAGVVVIAVLFIFWLRGKLTAPPAAIETPGEQEFLVPDFPVAPTTPITTDEPVTDRETGITLKRLSSRPVFDFWISPTTREVLYIDPKGKVWSAKEGPDLELSTQTISALNSTEISPDRQKALVAFGNPRLPEWGIFDFIDKVWRPLPANIISAAWAMEENTLFAIAVAYDGSRSLVKIELLPTLELSTLVANFNLRDVYLKARSETEILVIEKPSRLVQGRVWGVDLETTSLNLLFSPEEGLDIKFSDDREVVFKFSSARGFGILSANFEILAPTFFDTLPQKCAKERQIAYCFAPANFPAGAALPDDYFMRRFYSVDALFETNLETTETENVIVSGSRAIPALDAYNPGYLNGKLYFINRYDDYLYELTLPSG